MLVSYASPPEEEQTAIYEESLVSHLFYFFKKKNTIKLTILFKITSKETSSQHSFQEES